MDIRTRFKHPDDEDFVDEEDMKINHSVKYNEILKEIKEIKSDKTN